MLSQMAGWLEVPIYFDLLLKLLLFAGRRLVLLYWIWLYPAWLYILYTALSSF